MSNYIRYACASEMLPVVETALALNGYRVDIPRQRSIGGASALVLFGVGAYKAHLTVGHPGRSGLEMAIIGTVSALVGYGVGVVLKVPTLP